MVYKTINRGDDAVESQKMIFEADHNLDAH